MITVDRLALKLHGVSEQDARAIARRIVDRLAGATLRAGADSSIGAMRKQVETGPDENADALADRIAAEILRGLEREV